MSTVGVAYRAFVNVSRADSVAGRRTVNWPRSSVSTGGCAESLQQAATPVLGHLPCGRRIVTATRTRASGTSLAVTTTPRSVRVRWGAWGCCASAGGTAPVTEAPTVRSGR